MMRHTLFLIALVCSCVSLILIFGCNAADDDDDDADNDAGQDDDTADDDDDDLPAWEKVNVTWFPCSLYEGANDNRAECSSTPMLFNWFDDDGRTFTSYAKRLRSSDADVEGQLWLLHGGPGASGVIGFPSTMEGLQRENPNLDLYTLDPRGTGFSEYAACPLQQSGFSENGASVTPGEMDACIAYLEEKYGDDLGVFNVTNSAIDLGAYIHATKEEGKKVFIWGGSGGAFWAQRYLQFFPDQASGVILEGIPPAITSIAVQDEYADKMALKVFELCRADDFCSQKLPDPRVMLAALFDKLDSGHCSEIGMDTYSAKVMIDQLLYYYPHYEAIPAFIFRVDRCNEEDKAAIVHIFNSVFGSKGAAVKEDDEPFTDNPNVLYWSDVLFWNEMSSELWEIPEYPDYDAITQYLDGVYEDSVIGYEKGYTRNDIYNKWPRYSDPYDDTWADTNTPMLMLNGMLDPSTPYDWAEHVTDHFNGANQHFFGFPYAPHNTTGGSPYTDNPEDLHCADKLWFDFMDDPTGELDSSCVGQTLPPDFEGTLYANYFFGTQDYWENETPEPVLKNGDQLPWRFHVVNEQLRRKLRAQYPALRQHVMERMEVQ
jgi:pimeloyl-ACP methyl ester carboxylesterase